MYSFEWLNHALISADAISDEEAYVMSTLIYNDFEDGGALIVLGIVIEEQYQSTKLEKTILEEFLAYCSYMMEDYVAIIASEPLSERKKSDNIVEFPQLKMYEEFGFVTIKGSERNNPVMVRSLLL